MSLHDFCLWVSQTSLSVAFQSSSWVIAATQTVHILGIAVVFTSGLMVSLKLLGVAGRDVTAGAYAARFMPWIWWALPLLLLSGAVLIISEPARSLQNTAFMLKMVLLVSVIVLMRTVQTSINRASSDGGSSAGSRTRDKLLALVSLVLWMAIISAGRWIGYIDYV